MVVEVYSRAGTGIVYPLSSRVSCLISGIGKEGRSFSFNLDDSVSDKSPN
jgi:hypothetical protein